MRTLSKWPPPSVSWRYGIILLCAVALVCSSCTSRPAVHKVAGLVTVQGKPAENAVIVLRSVAAEPKAGPLPHAKVMSDGTFRIGTFADGDGAPAGDYLVTITWPEARQDPITRDTIEVDRLDGRYNNPQSSRWSVTIRPGDNELPPFRLD